MLMSEVASRYGITLSQKFAVQMVPFAGAIGGATLNSVFLRHYENTARAHFAVRRLERIYGAEMVRQAWTEGNAGTV